MVESIDPADKPPRAVTLKVDEPVGSFLTANGIATSPSRDASALAIDLDRLDDQSPLDLQGWIALTFADGPQGFTLPAGRVLNMSQMAGVIGDFSMTLFAEARPLAEIEAYLDGFLREMDAKSWRLDGLLHLPKTDREAERAGASMIICQLNDAQGNTMEVTLGDIGLKPKQESWIAVPLGRSGTPAHRYLLQVSVYFKNRPRDSRVAVYPRRLFLNGKDTIPVPLRTWIDQPDWSPPASGMIATTPEQRKRHPDRSFWARPE